MAILLKELLITKTDVIRTWNDFKKDMKQPFISKYDIKNTWVDFLKDMKIKGVK